MAKPSAPANRVFLRSTLACGPQPADAGEPTVRWEFDALLARLETGIGSERLATDAPLARLLPKRAA